MTFQQDGPPRSANDQLRVNVRELMEVRRWKQADLAERLGMSQPWLSKRLTGITPFHMEDVDAIAAAFGLAPWELLCGGFGSFDRRKASSDRRSGEDRRRKPATYSDGPDDTEWRQRTTGENRE
jgi:transcriptional regulator with XRE-family HTH domain